MAHKNEVGWGKHINSIPLYKKKPEREFGGEERKEEEGEAGGGGLVRGLAFANR